MRGNPCPAKLIPFDFVGLPEELMTQAALAPKFTASVVATVVPSSVMEEFPIAVALVYFATVLAVPVPEVTVPDAFLVILKVISASRAELCFGTGRMGWKVSVSPIQPPRRRHR